MLVADHLWRDDIVNISDGKVEAWTWTTLDGYVLCDGEQIMTSITAFDINEINKWKVVTSDEANQMIGAVPFSLKK